MITTSDIGNILYKDCKELGISVNPADKDIDYIPTEDIVLIFTKKQIPEKIWEKSMPVINLLVPDIGEDENYIRLNALERLAKELLKDRTGVYDGSRYSYSIDSIGKERDKEKKSHFISVTLLFKVLNVK